MDLQSLKKSDDNSAGEDKITSIKGLLNGLKTGEVNLVEPDDTNIDIISLDDIDKAIDPSQQLADKDTPSTTTTVIGNDLFTSDSVIPVNSTTTDTEIISLDKPTPPKEKPHISSELTTPKEEKYNTQILQKDHFNVEEVHEINLEGLDDEPINLNDDDNEIIGLDTDEDLDYYERTPIPEVEDSKPTEENNTIDESYSNKDFERVYKIVNEAKETETKKSELEKEIEELNESIGQYADTINSNPYIISSGEKDEISSVDFNINSEQSAEIEGNEIYTTIDSEESNEQPNTILNEVETNEHPNDNQEVEANENLELLYEIDTEVTTPTYEINIDNEATPPTYEINNEVASPTHEADTTDFNSDIVENSYDSEEIDLTGNDKDVQFKIKKPELNLDGQHIDYITYNKLSPSELIINREIILRLEKAIMETGNNFIIDGLDIKNIDDRVMKYKYNGKNIYQFKEIPEHLLDCPKRVEIRTKYLSHIDKIMEHFTANEDDMYLTLNKTNKDGYLILTKQEEQELINSLTKKFVIVENDRNTLKCLELQYE